MGLTWGLMCWPMSADRNHKHIVSEVEEVSNLSIRRTIIPFPAPKHLGLVLIRRRQKHPINAELHGHCSKLTLASHVCVPKEISPRIS